MFFGIFTELYNNYHNLSLGHFQSFLLNGLEHKLTQGSAHARVTD